MLPLLYGELASWYRLLDPPAEHAEEAACYQAAFERAVVARPEALLELGSGGGHNALHLKGRLRCTLSDRSPEMLALGRELNPECEHVLGDMRSLRLGRTFDVVLVHDAIAYMTTRGDLSRAAATAFVHTRPGGAALFAPDGFAGDFRESTDLLEAEDGTRALCALAWKWDPDPTDTSFTVDYAFMLREGNDVKVVHDRHTEGIFARTLWYDVLAEAGFAVETIPRPAGGGVFDEVFLCRRP